MKIIAAPDSFKGSISAKAAAEAMAAGIKEVLPAGEIIILPVADGGEGTVASLVAATQGRVVKKQAAGPLGKRVLAEYGVLGGETTCVVEIAQASGLPLLAAKELKPGQASTAGTGELIRHALDAGFREFIIGLGGSATNDGGTGMLRALGMDFLDAEGRSLPPGGLALAQLAVIDMSGFDPRIRDCRFIIASDVDNPLIGPNGASHVFGPQKGASQEMVGRLDAGLRRYADVVGDVTGISLHAYPGAGAAGGAGGAFLAFFPAELKAGIEVVLEASHFADHLETCDLILTGEGKSDKQTLAGKAPFGIAKLAAAYGKKVMLLSGTVDGKSRHELERYFEEVHSVAGDGITEKQSMEEPEKHIRQRTKELMVAYLQKSQGLG